MCTFVSNKCSLALQNSEGKHPPGNLSFQMMLKKNLPDILPVSGSPILASFWRDKKNIRAVRAVICVQSVKNVFRKTSFMFVKCDWFFFFCFVFWSLTKMLHSLFYAWIRMNNGNNQLWTIRYSDRHKTYAILLLRFTLKANVRDVAAMWHLCPGQMALS